MPSVRNKNFSGEQTPHPELIAETYIECNFSQPAAITDPDSGRKVGVPLFPDLRGTPREFINCNLKNCDVPPNSVVENCNTAITTKEVDEENIMVRGKSVRRIKKRRDVAHGRYVHDENTNRTHEEFPQS